jgi:hypothetical protein
MQTQTSNSEDSAVQNLNNETLLENSSGQDAEINSSEETATDNSTDLDSGNLTDSETVTADSSPSLGSEQEDVLPENSANEQTDSASKPVTEETIANNNAESGVLNTVAAFFLGILRPTGMAISEKTIETKIDGQASANEPFVYHLKDRENVQLLSGSVKTDSGSLPDSVIKMVYQDNLLLVSTNYSEIAKAKNENSTSISIEKISAPVLTDKEKDILSEKFGNFSIETVKSELFNGRYIIGYQLGEFSIEYSYDSNLSNETLNSQIESDKIKWLKDVSYKLNEKEPVHSSANFS